jgi:hypothetical protein
MRHFSSLSIVFNVFGTCEVRRMKLALLLKTCSEHCANFFMIYLPPPQAFQKNIIGGKRQLRKPSSQISNFNLRTGILITGTATQAFVSNFKFQPANGHTHYGYSYASLRLKFQPANGHTDYGLYGQRRR